MGVAADMGASLLVIGNSMRLLGGRGVDRGIESGDRTSGDRTGDRTVAFTEKFGYSPAMRIVVAILLLLQFSAGPVFAKAPEGAWAAEKASESTSGCVPGCPDDDRHEGKPCSDSCNNCVCCPAVTPLPQADSGVPVYRSSTRYRHFSVAFPVQPPPHDIFRPPRSV
jgi:hypothetical protein